MLHLPELLSPGGSPEGIRACINAGADAIYAGGSAFGARAYADNPDQDQMIDAIELCHMHGRRLYMTVNTLLREDELEKKLYNFLLPYYEHGLDAVLVQDLGVLSFIREHFPGLALHASTQLSISCADGARMMKELGCSRIVPARELSLEEIHKIHETVDIEIETFAHGALCFCYSGQCLMSSMIGGRSGNRGRCAQPCRQPYSFRGGKQEFALSPKDINTLAILPKILRAGVISLKLEGRMKQPEYAAGVTAVYRRYLDKAICHITEGKSDESWQVEKEDEQILKDLFNRGGFSRGYYQMPKGSPMMMHERPGKAVPRTSPETLEWMHEVYMEENPSVKIQGKFIFCEGRSITLELTGPGHMTVSVTGNEPQPAKNRPVTSQDLERVLKKTGGSGFTFEKLDIEAKDGLFIPMGEIASLRREALERLKEKMLSGTYRPVPEPPAAASHTSTGADATPPALIAHVISKEQLQALLEIDGIRAICLEGASYLGAKPFGTERTDPSVPFGTERTDPSVPFLEDARRIHAAHKLCLLSFPNVWRERIIEDFCAFLDEDILSVCDGFILHNVQQLYTCRERWPDMPVTAGQEIYSWNMRSRRAIRAFGASDTVSAELNRRQILPGAGGMVIYGRTILMTTAQCLTLNHTGCAAKEGLDVLTDRTGAAFLVRRVCGICTNQIYNSVPLDLLGEMHDVLRCGAARLYLHFTDENASQTTQIAKEACARLAAMEPGQTHPPGARTKKDRPGTRGHFKRGVE